MSGRPACVHCRGGWLGGSGYPCDHECVNGIAIDADVFAEGWPRDVAYPPAPCHPAFCRSCDGRGDDGEGDCPSCDGSGYRGGAGDSQRRLDQAAGGSRRRTVRPAESLP